MKKLLKNSDLRLFVSSLGAIGVTLLTGFYVSSQFLSHKGGFQLIFGSVLGAVSVIAAIWLSWLWDRRDDKAQLRMDVIRTKIQQLADTHAELALVLEIQQLQEEERGRYSDRRSFWTGMFQNCLFFVLGFLISQAHF